MIQPAIGGLCFKFTLTQGVSFSCDLRKHLKSKRQHVKTCTLYSVQGILLSVDIVHDSFKDHKSVNRGIYSATETEYVVSSNVNPHVVRDHFLHQLLLIQL